MSIFVNTYINNTSALFYRMVSLPETSDIIAVGKIGSNGLILKIDGEGKVLWELELEYSSQIYFYDLAFTQNGEVIVLGSMTTKINNRRHHLTLKVSTSGRILFFKEVYSPQTRRTNALTTLNSGEFLISGWYNSSGSEDKVETISFDQEGNLLHSGFLDLGNDIQVRDTENLGKDLLFAGGANSLRSWAGFLIRTNAKLNFKSAHFIKWKEKNSLEEIDKILSINDQEFLLFGRRKISNERGEQSILFFSKGKYSNDNLTLTKPISISTGHANRIKRVILLDSELVILGYEETSKKHFIIKMDYSGGYETLIRRNSIITFEIGVPYILNDIIALQNGFALCGNVIQREGKEIPLVIKTDSNLNCCFTEDFDRELIFDFFENLEVIQHKGKFVPIETVKNIKSEARRKKQKSSLNELCSPTEPEKCNLAFVAWNSLEPRARTNNFKRPLQAQIRDGMWMLSRQVQWGEFNGGDRGTMVYSKVSWRNTQLNRYSQMADGVNALNKPYSEKIPLEYQVERLDVEIKKDWLLRIEAGRYWKNLLKHHLDAVDYQTYSSLFLSNYSIKLPVEPTIDSTSTKDAQNEYLIYAQLISQEDTWSVLNSLEGRAIDGGEIYDAIKDNSIFNSAAPSHLSLLNNVKNDFLKWYLKKYSDINSGKEAWSENHLEHKFGLRAPNVDSTNSNNIKLKGSEYPGGHLDWYSVDLKVSNRDIQDDTNLAFNENVLNQDVEFLIPAKLNFPGMPHPRWWQMEDHQVDFGDMHVNTTDVSKLLLLDFINNYANNWYIIPFQAAVGSLTEIGGIEVKDNFGIRTLIRPANVSDLYKNQGGQFREWEIFQLKKEESSKPSPDSLLYLAPAVANIQEGKPIEKVTFIRDEVANMVWGIESTHSDGLNKGIKGHEASISLLRFLNGKFPETISVADDNEKPLIKYRLATSVPENWIPFIPVHKTGSNRAIDLQRATMPRNIEGVAKTTISPRTQLLRPNKSPYFIHEEEIPKAGRIVSTTWQRARWFGGRTFIWKGNHKKIGRGEGNSGLKFDQLHYPK